MATLRRAINSAIRISVLYRQPDRSGCHLQQKESPHGGTVTNLVRITELF